MEQSILNAGWIFVTGFFIGLFFLMVGSFPKPKNESGHWTSRVGGVFTSVFTLLIGFIFVAVNGFMMFVCLIIDVAKQKLLALSRASHSARCPRSRIIR